MSLDIIDRPQDVRAVLGLLNPSLNPVLEDESIQSAPFGGFAESHVKAAIDDWDDILTGADSAQKLRLRNAAIYFAAALLCKPLASGAIPAVENGGSIDWKERQAEYLGLYGTVMAELQEVVLGPLSGDLLPQPLFRMGAHGPCHYAEPWMTFPPLAWVDQSYDPVRCCPA